jgi:hypothetical protein
MANFLGVEEDENIVYADDSNVWQTGSTKEDVARKLAKKAALFVEYTRKMGLHMYASKTQLLFSSRAGNVTKTPVEVDGSLIHPGDTIELLGVRYDRKLLTTPHVKALLAAVRQRAPVIARLANHLPRGEYLRQLSSSRTRWRPWHGQGWSKRTTRPWSGAGSRWPLTMSPGVSPARGEGTMSRLRTCSPRPASRAQSGW